MATHPTTVSAPRRPARAAARGAARMVVALVLAGLPAGGHGATAAPLCPRADVWVVSTRRLPGICQPPERASPDVERLSCGDHGRWEPSSVEELLAEPDLPLAIFIHGNRYAAADAKTQGVQFARIIAARCPDAGPVRTVVFSWPSEKERSLLRDVRLKYERAPADGHYLGWLLGRVEPERHVAIAGHSYGAIIGLEALRDRVVAERGGDGAWADRPGRTHLVLVAPAVRCDALAPRGRYHEALTAIDRLTLVANSADCALSRFDCVEGDGNVEALGSVILPRRWLPADVEYSACDAAAIVGIRHRLPLYLESPSLAGRIAAGAVAGFGPPAAP